MTTFSATIYNALAGAASTDPHRSYMTAVRVEPHSSGHGAILVATDGHILAAAYDTMATVPEPVSVTTDKSLVKATRLKKADHIKITNNWDFYNAEVLASNGEKLHIQPGGLLLSEYPDWRHIVTAINPAGPATGHFSVNVADRVASTSRALSAAFYGEKIPALIWSQNEPTDPALVRIVGIDNAFMIAMPMRVVDERVSRGLPGWMS